MEEAVSAVVVARDGRDDGMDIFSRQTGQRCSSFADGDGAASCGDVLLEEAKKGPSRLTPSSPVTWPA